MHLHSDTTVRRPKGQARRDGLTMVEVVVSTMLVGLVVVASMRTVGSTLRTWQAIEEQQDGTTLAADLMTEVMQARYFDPEAVESASAGGGGLLGDILDSLGDKNNGIVFGLDSGELSTSRATWDDTDDYDDWSKSPPQTKFGVTLNGYTGWTRAVNVQKVKVGQPNNTKSNNATDEGLRRITVTVTAPDGKQTVLVGLRSYCGTMEHPAYAPGVEPRYVIWVGSGLQIGANSNPIQTGTNIANHAEDE